MDDAVLVCELESFGDLTADVQSFICRQGTFCDPLCQIFALHQFHHQEALPICLLEPVYGGDVGVIERRQELRFALEPDQPLGISR